jgi:hypothetical protein
MNFALSFVKSLRRHEDVRPYSFSLDALLPEGCDFCHVHFYFLPTASRSETRPKPTPDFRNLPQCHRLMQN